MKTWRDKAHRRIGELCRAEYLRVNTTRDGRRRKTHRPYVVPLEAEILVDCLATDDEHRAKSLFVWTP